MSARPWPKGAPAKRSWNNRHAAPLRGCCPAGPSCGSGSRVSPWVAHARGARYVPLGDPPSQAIEAARRALVATGLWDSFGCVDLLLKPTGEWVVLEVGTDGLFNHVDRDLGDSALERELHRRVAQAFWRVAERYDTSSYDRDT